MTVIVAGANPKKVQYKVPGRFYNTEVAEASSTSDPFDELVIPAGTSGEIPDGAEIIKIVEMGGAPTPGGTPEDFKADSNAPTPTPGGGIDQSKEIDQYNKAGG